MSVQMIQDHIPSQDDAGNKMTQTTTMTLPALGRVGRRALLKGTAGLVALAALQAVMPRAAFAAGADEQSFLDLSSFLTGKTLDPTLSRRYLAALQKRNADLMDRLGAVQKAITDSGAANIDALIANPVFDDSLRETVKLVVTAWYRGIVGDPEDAELITYAEALMYAPTKGILSVPTYGPGPAGWGPNPAARAN